jgi:guanylate kinase
MTMQGRCVIVSAPSGAGKTTIVRHLRSRFPELAFSVSATSRPERPNERDGHDYWFITAEEFLRRVKAGDFVEWEEVYPGRYYGTLRSELETIWSRGHHAIFDVDVKGGSHLKDTFGSHALALFIAPPSLDILEERLRSRGTETPESLRERVDKAAHEMDFASRFDAIVVNDDLRNACDAAEKHVRAFLSLPAIAIDLKRRS